MRLLLSCQRSEEDKVLFSDISLVETESARWSSFLRSLLPSKPVSLSSSRQRRLLSMSEAILLRSFFSWFPSKRQLSFKLLSMEFPRGKEFDARVSCYFQAQGSLENTQKIEETF
uniref:Uncharacterized protein n=1 Tax=Populus davidiana TaxID=266767 RepID=A0A6M2F726_9ROSI